MSTESTTPAARDSVYFQAHGLQTNHAQRFHSDGNDRVDNSSTSLKLVRTYHAVFQSIPDVNIRETNAYPSEAVYQPMYSIMAEVAPVMERCVNTPWPALCVFQEVCVVVVVVVVVVVLGGG